MADFKISRFRYTWKNSWVSETEYNRDDVVSYGGKSYVCIVGHTADTSFYLDLNFIAEGETSPSPRWIKMTDGYAWRSEWAGSVDYNLGDIVFNGGVLYLCTEQHTSSGNIDADLENWTVYISADRWTNDWVASTRYKIGDLVKYNGTVYRCIAGHTASNNDNGLEFNQDSWDYYAIGVEYVGEWTTGIRYRLNDYVKFGGSLWRCKQGHTSGTDSTLNFDGEEHWNLEVPGFQRGADWNNFTVYQVGDIIRHGGWLYYCLVNNYNSNPSASQYQLVDKTNPPDWAVINKGINFREEWQPHLTYKSGDVVRRGGNAYVALIDTTLTADESSLSYLDSSNWELITVGSNWRGAWNRGIDPADSSEFTGDYYSINDFVTFYGNTYKCNFEHQSSSQNFPGDNGSGFNYWDLVLLAGPTAGMTARGDLLTYDLSQSLKGDGSTVGATNVEIGQNETVIKVNSENSVSYDNWGTQSRLVFVSPTGVDDETDTVRGYNFFKPWRTIRFAAEQIEKSGANQTATFDIRVFPGEYEEILPIIVPKNCTIKGDEVRAVTVKPNQPIAALADDSQYTIAVLNRISQIIEAIIAGTRIEKSPGNLLDQILPDTVLVQINTPYQPALFQEDPNNPGSVIEIFIVTFENQLAAGSPAAASSIQEKIQDIIDYINYYVNSTGLEPTLTGSNTAVTTTGYTRAVSILENNKEFLAAEAVAWMQENNPAYQFNSEKCKRDIRAFIDAWKYDLIYTGNYKSVLAARYYRNAILGSVREDMFYVRDSTGVRNMTLSGLTGTLNPTGVFEFYQRPTGGAYVSLDPGWGPDDERVWITTRSCYVQNCATFGYAAVGQKIDGSLHNGGNRSIVSNDFTQIIDDGIGAWVLNNGRAELVSVFTYYSQVGYLAEAGGIIRATNGNNSYGTYGAMALGNDPAEIPRYSTVNNRNNQATVDSAFAGEVNDEILILEFTNAGLGYTTAEYNVSGAGVGANAIQEDFRDKAVYKSQLITPPEDDSTIAGGSGFTTVINNAQSGNETTIVLAASDANSESEYLGLRIIIFSGSGTGQYGYISAYSPSTKIVTVRKESNDELGWDHVIPGTPILTTILPSARYSIEPRPIFSAPSYSSSTVSFNSTAVYANIAYGETYAVYNNITGSSGTGTIGEDGVPVSATWNITKNGRRYAVALSTAGAGYADEQVVIISGTSVGGVTPDNDITIRVKSISNDSTNSIVTFQYSGIAASGNFVVTPEASTLGQYSSDGTTWNDFSLPSSGNWKALTNGNNMFVSIRRGSAVSAYSYNGIDWISPITSGLLSRNWEAIAYGIGKFVAISNNLNSAAYSINGITWIPTVLPTFGDSTFNEWVDVAYGRGRFVAIANTGNVAAHSLDGINWVGALMDVIADSSQRDWVSVTYGNGRFVALSSQGDVAYSFDGDFWYASGIMPKQDGSTVMTWVSIQYSQGVFLALCDTGGRIMGADITTGETRFAAQSPDGITWTGIEVSTPAKWKVAAFGSPDITVGDSTLGNITPMWIAIPQTSSLVATKIQTGTRAIGRVRITSGRISKVNLLDPGSGYTSEPTLTIIDPNNTGEIFTDNKIGDGVLAQPSWVDKGVGYRTSTTTIDITGDGLAEELPVSKFVTISDLVAYPGPGAQFRFDANTTLYTVVAVTELGDLGDGTLSGYFQISPPLTIDDQLNHGTRVEIRERYSQCRITGHDFLDIGTGNFAETNYPELYTTAFFQSAPENEVVEETGGRVFYTSTDQSGNFRTGELFAVEQATGIVTISADFFDLGGLQELKLGGVRLGGSGVVIREFSTDPLFLEDSNNVVATQRAVKTYLASRLSVSSSDLTTFSLTAGEIKIGPDSISNILGLVIEIPVLANFAGANAHVSGSISAQTMFYRSFKDNA